MPRLNQHERANIRRKTDFPGEQLVNDSLLLRSTTVQEIQLERIRRTRFNHVAATIQAR